MADLTTDPQIETPRGNGTTDVPSSPDVARNEASATVAGYPVQHAPIDYAALAQQAGGTYKPAQTAPVSQSTPPPPTIDYAALAKQHGGIYTSPEQIQNKQQDTEPKAGFVSTVGSDIGGAVKSIAKLPLQVAEHATIDRPSAEANQTYADAMEAHKHQVYQQFKDDFHAGKYLSAFSGLTNLFDPSSEDPNDPLQKVMQGQWESSKLAKDRAVEAVKNKDYAAAVQHAAGVMPVASQVDSAMENYRKDPSRENLAHIVTSAIPAFIPAIAHGAGAGIEALSDVGEVPKSPLAPTTVDIAGQPVPVRAVVANPTMGNRIVESLASKEPLQKFDVTQTQPAARAAIGRVATKSVTNPTFETLGKAEHVGAWGAPITVVPDDLLEEATRTGQPVEDVIADRMQKMVEDFKANGESVDKYWNDKLKTTSGDFGTAYNQIKAELSRFYEKADVQGMKDGAGKNAFSQAQREQQAAFRSGNIDAENTAIAAQRTLFDEANGVGTYDVVKKLYPKLDAVDAISTKFTASRVIKNTPSQFLKDLPKGYDEGIVDGSSLRTAVRELRTDGTFSKAGVDDAHVMQLEKLGDLLERSKVRPDLKPSGLFGKAMQQVKNAPLGAGNQLAYLMTHPNALDAVVSYLREVGPASTAVAATGNITHRYNTATQEVEALPIAP